ncbi:hypothetical protein AB0K00_29880 [Dactylosporangium sp. NPDC049525]|uniref:hypothetical protein n=1 Tax=Dactylosporangium sp. NPDC049525 TaxID=3154730 RepID=UPI00342E7381
MQLRRALVTLAISAALGLVAGCGQEPGSTTQPAAPVTTAASSKAAAASGPVAAGTGGAEAVCKAIIEVYEAEKRPLVSAYGEYVTATVLNDQAKIPERRAKVEEIIKRLSQAAHAELAKATDPHFKAALADYIAVAQEVYLTPNEDAALDAKLKKVVTAAQQYCPALGK